MPEITLRAMQPEDWADVRRIYLEGIASGNSTFQTEAPTWEQWDANHLQACRLVAIQDNGIVGWAVLAAISARPVYRGVAEVSVYVAPSVHGQGVGSTLMHELVAASEQLGFWTLQAGIFPENVASLALHARVGFRQVGRREKMGQLHGAWRDVVLVERRVGSEMAA
ncbi:N-acetyltransferase [Duganella sp. LX20W]|uniref:N-acetyltransferase n=1 Tax=Rugamonas brunnea TaxID=2758569 RepID=A0A7W2ICU0_9BURK|nr:GNAT family N-acetyltransferase [Rugamonas brunnea]MBA5638608.1 N-acetyltransferase [Rugamonas brunnea]